MLQIVVTKFPFKSGTQTEVSINSLVSPSFPDKEFSDETELEPDPDWDFPNPPLFPLLAPTELEWTGSLEEDGVEERVAVSARTPQRRRSRPDRARRRRALERTVVVVAPEQAAVKVPVELEREVEEAREMEEEDVVVVVARVVVEVEIVICVVVLEVDVVVTVVPIPTVVVPVAAALTPVIGFLTWARISP
jgi:hypothetical protein